MPSLDARLLMVGLALTPAVSLAAQQLEVRRAPYLVDVHGDPLPAGALSRLGTVRLRHGGGVTGIAFARNGKLLASGSVDGTARLWEIPSGKELRQFRLNDPVRAIALSPDGSVLAMAGDDSIIHLRDVARGTELHQLECNRGGIHALAFAPDGALLASGHPDGSIQLWKVATGAKVRQWPAHRGRIWSVAFSRDGKRLASGGDDLAARIWDPVTARRIHQIESQRAVYCVAFSPVASLLAVGGGKENVVRLVSPETGKVEKSLAGHFSHIRSLAFSGDGKTLVSGGLDKEIHVWDVTTGRERRHFPDMESEVGAVALSADGLTLAIGTADRAIQLLDAVGGMSRLAASGHALAVAALAYAASGKQLATRSMDGLILLWDPTTGKVVRQLGRRDGPGHLASVPPAFFPDGTRLACADSDKKLTLWDAATGKEIRSLLEFGLFLRAVAWSADGKILATGVQSEGVKVRDLATGAVLQTMEGGAFFTINVLQLSPNGKILAAVGTDSVVHVWDTGSGSRRWSLHAAQKDALDCLAFSPNSALLATVSRVGTTYLWDLTSGKEHHFQGKPARALAFSPDGRVLAAADGADGSILLWDVATGKVRTRFAGHQGGAVSLAFAPDGRTLVSGSVDTTALVWDVTGRVWTGRLPRIDLTATELDGLWNDLGALTVPQAQQAAVWTLVAGQRHALPFLRKQMGPLRKELQEEGRLILKLVADLDNDRFKTRARAFRELAKLGTAAELALRDALARSRSVEVRRSAEKLLEQLRKDTSPLSATRVRILRVIEVLEHVDNPEATALLKQLAEGDAETWLTRETKAALDRLANRPGPAP
jgi:WD40 repeat protein